jgi:gliding motility-associated-like protein
LYPADTSVTPGTQVRLHASINQDIQSFHWTPGAMLVTASTLTPTTVPIFEGIDYRLSVETLDGCLIYKDVSIKPKYPLYIPNAFTPNGDGKNDLFRIPPYVEFDLSEMIIFNRWGEVVFSTRDIEAGWDGRFRGVHQPSDVYVYQISGMVKGEKVLLKGSMTLIR